MALLNHIKQELCQWNLTSD